MKANELMIGDWICSSINDINVRIAPADLNWDNAHTEWLANSKPIPLTAEILEKNGFKKQGFDGWEYLIHTEDNNDIKCMILWRTDYGTPRLTITPHLTIRSWVREYGDFSNWGISSVHQLQHALRLCGLSELADNFKV